MTQPSGQNFKESNDETRPISDREQLLANAVADFLDLQAREEKVNVDDFCRRYPGLGPALKAELQSLDQIEDLLDDSTAADPIDDIREKLPERLSGHRILGIIGAGGMGRVLLAADEALGRKVAIKILSQKYRNNPVLRTRFMNEARAMARLSHPNIVHIYNLGQPDEEPHFVMEHIEGTSLLEAARALTIEQKVELIHKVVLAVEFLHQHQIIHRDLKPGNILVGPDLEPKLLDFGLARQVDDRSTKLTLAGEVMGTPDYFSPEQARAEEPLDARSDVFSLGTILYQLLTGVAPFRAERFSDQVRMICEQDPVLPRRLNKSVPGDLQNICLKAVEKNPADRYGSARELADDLERFLAGEAVLANPTSYSRLMAGKIKQHLRELNGWRQDRILSAYEYDSFRKLYDRLVEREDAWLLETRRLSLSQVALYLGGWILVLGALLVGLFRYKALSGTTAVLLISAVTALMAYMGIRRWNRGQLRIAIADLLVFCLLLPTLALIAMNEWKLLTHFSQGKKELEIFVQLIPTGTTNAQMWWSILLSLPAYFWLRRFTKSSVFSLVIAVMGVLFCLATLLRMGMLEWLKVDPGKVYFHLIPVALLFFVLAVWMERLKYPTDSRYFYPIAVLCTFVALSGLAATHKPYAEWLESVAPKTRGQLEYLFIINAGFYLALQSLSERFGSAQMRSVAKAFRFVIPGHVLTSLLLLGLKAYGQWQDSPSSEDLRLEARFFEILLPMVACMFVFGSIPKQMKNFLVTGLLFLAIGITRLQQDLFKERAVWPMSLLIAGLLLMYLAANYTPIKLALTRWIRRMC